MFHIPINSQGSLNQNTLLSINLSAKEDIKTFENIESLNQSAKKTQTSPLSQSQPFLPSATPSPSSPASTLPIIQIPSLKKPVLKGQKTAIEDTVRLKLVNACFGWNVKNSLCDVDVSAFLLNSNGKVLGDDWFVFYGQTSSPDQSVTFYSNAPNDREQIKIDFQKLHPSVQKIVFVLTINEAFEKNLNFGMIKDAYIRIINQTTNSELVSFPMTEYYTNVISMIIGELYKHNGIWKFNAVGNGVAKDLSGLCKWYGVQVLEN